MNQMNNFQNWEKTVLKKETGKKNNHTGHMMNRIDEYDPDHISDIKYSNKLLGQAIVRARTGMKLKQTDIDKKCNFSVNTCNSYEKGTAVYNHNQVNTLARVLNTRLPRPT